MRWAWENKKPFFIGFVWGKTSADGGGRTTGAWGSVGRVGENTSAIAFLFLLSDGVKFVDSRL